MPFAWPPPKKGISRITYSLSHVFEFHGSKFFLRVSTINAEIHFMGAIVLLRINESRLDETLHRCYIELWEGSSKKIAEDPKKNLDYVRFSEKKGRSITMKLYVVVA